MSGSKGAAHETLRDVGPKQTATDKSFGVVFTVVFAIVAGFQFYAGRMEWGVGLLALAGVTLVVAMLRPALLAPFNKLWTRFGLLLHHVMNPIILGIIFFLVCTPMGLVARLFGFDPLRTKADPGASTYWIERDPAGPEPGTMKNQF